MDDGIMASAEEGSTIKEDTTHGVIEKEMSR
jgi:hypothetical protein